MNSDTKEQYFYIRNKRCKVVANDQCITIQSELTPNLQTVINLTDLIAIRSCTCRKTPTKLVCKCIQAKVNLEQANFVNPSLTKNVINGNFEKQISFVHADGAFDSNGQFQLRRVDSTLSSDESNVELDEELNEIGLNDEKSDHNVEENNMEDGVDENGLEDYMNDCIEEIYSQEDQADDICMNEDEGVMDDDLVEEFEVENGADDKSEKKKEKDTKFRKEINREHVTKLLIKGSSCPAEKKDAAKVTRISKNLNHTIMSLESNELNSPLEDNEYLIDQENNSDYQQVPGKRRVSILKDYAQSTLMTSTSSGISTSSCNSTLNKSSQPSNQAKTLIRCVRIYYSTPYASFNFKIKCINLVPEYLQDNIVITPETIYNSNNEPHTKFTIKNGSVEMSIPTKSTLTAKFDDSLNTLNSLPTEADQQRMNIISLMNATSQNRILEQKKIKQFVAFVKDYLQEFNRPKSLLLFINPVGGKKRAPIIYKKICQPLLWLASIKAHTIVTQKANHAYQLLRDENVDLSYYHALGCVGGDGMYSELLNGMLKRNRSSNRSTPVPMNLSEPVNNEKRQKHNSSINGAQAKQCDTSDNSTDGQIRNDGERSLSAQSELSNNISKQQRNAIQKLIQLTNKHDRRSKLGVRYSLPNDRTPNIDHNELNKLKYGKHGKRYSLPVSPFRSKSTDLGNRNNLPILIVPGGSTDAVAYSTNGINDPQTVMINFLLGKQINVDVAAVHTADEDNRLLKYCSSFLGYGFFGDVLRDSEENRWMGPKRYDWAGLKKFFMHKVYNGELLLKVSLLDGDPKDNNLCLSNCQLCAKSYIRNLFNQTDPNGLRKNSVPESVKNKANRNAEKQDDENNNMNVENCEDEDDGLIIKNINNKNVININRKPSDEDENTSLICIKGRFLAINAATMTCRCGHSKYGISPSNHIGNGCCDLIIVIAQCTRTSFLKYLIRTGFSEKSAFDLDFVNVYRVKEFTFKPTVESNQVSVESVWNCDGEILNEAAINVKIHCQMVSVFGNGVEIRASNKTFVKKEKLQNAFNLKWKNKANLEGNESKKKRYKPSANKSDEQRRSSKVEFAVQPNLVC